MKTRQLHAALASLALAALASPSAVKAQEYERARAGIAVGAFVTDRASTTRLNPDNGTGTDIDLEDDLGLEASMTVGRLDGYYWFNARHRIDVAFFDLSRSASRTIDETIVFGDRTFLINTVVHSEADLEITKVDYTFAVLDRDRGYLGVTGGVYVASTRHSLSEATLGTAETEDLTAPLPVFGVRGEYQIADRITLGGAAQWFGVDVEDTSGRFTDIYVGADYRFGQRFRLGIAYDRVSMNIAVEKPRGFSGQVDWGYDGWLVYFKTELGDL